MSDLNEVALVVALFIAASFLYFSMDRWVQERYDAAETGLAGGAPMSAGFRRLLLTTRVMPAIATVVIVMGFLGIGWAFIGEAIDSESAKLLAYSGFPGLSTASRNRGFSVIIRKSALAAERYGALCYASPHAALLVDLRSDRCVRLRYSR